MIRCLSNDCLLCRPYHAKEVAGFEVAGVGAALQEPVRIVRPSVGAHREAPRRRPREHHLGLPELPESLAPAQRKHIQVRTPISHRLVGSRSRTGQRTICTIQYRKRTYVSMAPARSAGEPADAATSLSMETTRSSGSSSNMSPARRTPGAPAAAGDPSAAVLRLFRRCTASGPSPGAGAAAWQE